jgi:hypothetical protein
MSASERQHLIHRLFGKNDTMVSRVSSSGPPTSEYQVLKERLQQQDLCLLTVLGAFTSIPTNVELAPR